jgi:hypothetical protein
MNEICLNWDLWDEWMNGKIHHLNWDLGNQLDEWKNTFI